MAAKEPRGTPAAAPARRSRLGLRQRHCLLGSAGRFPNALIDAKRVVAWVRSRATSYGADPSMVIVAGSSASAHLTAMAALTGNDSGFQPGFEHDGTSATGGVCLHGYYGARDVIGSLPSSPEAYVGAPRFARRTASGG